MKRTLSILLLLFFVVKLNAQAPKNEHPWLDTDLSAEERIEALISKMTLEEKVSQMLNGSAAIDRLGIKKYNWWNEALHGVARNGRATVFPQAIGMGATFDENLLLRVATAISDEARAKFNVSQKIGNYARYAGLTFWTPNINIFRDPRWGRGQETYGEDPFLTGKMGSAMVRGLQGDNKKYLKAAACAKHYAVHSGPEALRHEYDAKPNMKDLYETYLPAFEMLVVDAKVEAVMGAYNRVFGEPACGSKLLLKDILRDKWGFKGHVVSDCGAIEDFHRWHKVTKTPEESAALAVKMGTDLNCGKVYNALPKAVKEGLVTEAEIDERLKALLRTKIKLGFFDPVDDNPYNAIPESVINCEKHVNLAYEAASKSVVLLQNKNNVLPLDKNIRHLYVVGPFATSSEVLLGNYYGLSSRTTNILDGITAKVSAGTTINYKQGILPFSKNVNPIDWTTGEAKSADAIIAVMGLSGAYEGEEGEAIASPNKGDKLDLKLPAHQIEFLKKLRKNNKKPIIVIITAGSPVCMPEIEKLADVILFAWYPGQEGGRAIGDIVFGDVAPSGRLPLTFPRSEKQLPPYDDYSMKGRTYRYMTEKPLYPFGFGLSYSKVEFSAIKLVDLKKGKMKKGMDLTVKCTVKNIGERKIEEVAQLYLSAPGAGAGQPISSLKGFKRVILDKGESKSIEFKVPAKDLMVVTEKGEIVYKKGEFKVSVGNSSPGERSTELGAAKPQVATFVLK